MPTMENEKKTEGAFKTLQAAAERLGIPYASVRRLVLDGHLPGAQLGNSRRWWIKASELEKFIRR